MQSLPSFGPNYVPQPKLVLGHSLAIVHIQGKITTVISSTKRTPKKSPTTPKKIYPKIVSLIVKKAKKKLKSNKNPKEYH